MKQKNAGLESYVVWAGSASEAARILDVSKTHVCQMRKGDRNVTPELAQRMELTSKGKVRKSAVRPDLWAPRKGSEA